MKRRVSWSLGIISMALALALPTNARAQQGLRADMQMSGGALTSPASGALYFSGESVRLELAMDGQGMILIGDPTAGSLNLLMPDQQMYMPVSAGMSPVTPPPVTNLDPANPCASGEVTNCVSLGTAQVNGYETAAWQYDSNGETWNVWISTELQFPVRLVGADGTTTDFTDIAMGPQDASLFEIPAGYSAMPSFGGFAAGFGAGGGGGRGGRGGLPGGRGANAGPGVAGLPPGFDPAAFGIDPATLAGIMAGGGGNPEPSVWDGGDGWMVTVRVTASGERTSSEVVPGAGATESRETYSIRTEGSVPLNYGTPGAIGVGPRWQLVPGIGSDRGNAATISFSGEAEYHSEGSFVGECSYTWVRDTRGSVTWDGGSATSENPSALLAIGFMQISPDLQTYELSIGVGRDVEETTEGMTNLAACPPDPASSEPINETGSGQYNGSIGLVGLPLPATRSTLTGTRTMPIQFEFGGFSGELEATVEWTIAPI